MAKSKIEWTEDTWNPIVGCSIVSPGCTNCYAMRMAARLERMGNAPQYNSLTKKVNGKVIWTGKVALAEKALLKPLKRRKPTTYFVNSMGDLFHEDAPDEWIDMIFAVIALCPQHTFQVLTKRADRMREYMKKAFDRVVIHMLGLTSEGCQTPETLVPHMEFPGKNRVQGMIGGRLEMYGLESLPRTSAARMNASRCCWTHRLLCGLCRVSRC